MNIKYTEHLLRTKGFLGLYYRSRQILQRFGITSKKIENCLDTFINITTDEFGYNPTLCVTAILLDKYPKIIEKLDHKKAEMGIHGYIHTDYKILSEKRINDDLQKAKSTFKKHGIPLVGIRFPYLSWNNKTLRTIKDKDILWSSNQIICWDVLDKNSILKGSWSNFQRVIKNLYVTTRYSSNYLSLPRRIYDFVEIPISLPDDEIIIDRLGITKDTEIAQIWQKILKESNRRGELFTLQTHHERVPFFQNALRLLLKEVYSLEGKIWVASLGEISKWWREKNEFNFKITNKENNYYHIKANCLDKATILVKKTNNRDISAPLLNNYQIINNKEFSIKCDKKPIIGIAEHSPQELINFLHEEGFMVEAGLNKNNYAVYLGDYHTFNTKNEKELIDTIELSPFPLIRFWRWPNNAQSAFAITGDIDGITLFDFLNRYLSF